MHLVEIKNDVAFMTQDGESYMAAIDCFESSNEFVAVKIHALSGLPVLVHRTSLQAIEIERLFNEPEFKRYV